MVSASKNRPKKVKTSMAYPNGTSGKNNEHKRMLRTCLRIIREFHTTRPSTILPTGETAETMAHRYVKNRRGQNSTPKTKSQ